MAQSPPKFGVIFGDPHLMRFSWDASAIYSETSVYGQTKNVS